MKVSTRQNSPRSLQLRGSTLWVPAGFHDYSNLPQCLPNPAFSPTTLVKISIKTNKPKQRSQHQRTGLHLIKTFSAAVSSSGVPMKTVYACQGSQLALACPPDHQIRVMRANYGRFSVAICNDKGITDWSVNCMAPRSLRIMQDRWAGLFEILKNDNTAFQSSGQEQTS